MAVDKLVDSAQLDGALTATANSIRGKTGDSSQIAWDMTTGFKDAIDGIPSGSSQIKFGVIRNDAELLRSYTYDKLLVKDLGITIPSYSTTSKTLVSSSSLSPTITMSYADYHY